MKRLMGLLITTPFESHPFFRESRETLPGDSIVSVRSGGLAFPASASLANSVRTLDCCEQPRQYTVTRRQCQRRKNFQTTFFLLSGGDPFFVRS
jgi:hypothetical protein